jgi:hypothetical protein
VIGAAIEVHRLLGPGFLESVYEEALCIELSLRGIRYARQQPVGLACKGKTVGEARRPNDSSTSTGSDRCQSVPKACICAESALAETVRKE